MNMNNFDKLYNLDNLYNAYVKAKQGTDWKESVQRYEANLLLNLLSVRKEIISGKYKPKPMVEFTLCERGHTRQIKAQNIYDRVVQRCLNDNILIPKVRPKLIYDNGASLEGRGLDFARKRFGVHLQKAFREFGSDAYVLMMDFTKYYDNVRHDKALSMFGNVLSDEELEFLKITFKEFEVDVSYMADEEYEHCLDKVFSSVEYAKIPRESRLGRKFMAKSLGIGNQSAQIAGVFYPSSIDNYCKIVRGIKYYGRYMDDTYIIMKDKNELQRLLKEIENRCLKLGIFVNMKKTHIYKISGWLTWLKINYKLKNTGGIIRKIHSSSIRRERRRLKKFQKAWKQGSMNLASIKQCYRSWRGSYAKYDSTEKLRKIDKYFKELFEEAEQNERDGN